MKQFHWILIVYTLAMISALFGFVDVDLTDQAVNVFRFLFYLSVIIFIVLMIWSFEPPKPPDKLYES